jgi:hypothetical protein
MDPEVNVGQGVFTNPITAAFREIGHTDPVCIAVEFECDGCCKKASNARFLNVIAGFLVLVSFDGACILVKTISGGTVVEKEIVKAIVIPLSRVCSIEIGAMQVDP